MGTSTLYYVVNAAYQRNNRFSLEKVGPNVFDRNRANIRDRGFRDRIVIHKLGPKSYRFQIYRSKGAFWSGKRTGKGTTEKQCLNRAFAEYNGRYQ